MLVGVAADVVRVTVETAARACDVRSAMLKGRIEKSIVM